MKNENTPKTKTRQKKNSSFVDEISWNGSSLNMGDSFSRFRALGAVQATITLGILTLIMGY
jgi:hypothetical protein